MDFVQSGYFAGDYLTNTLPVSTNTVYNTPADLSTANGYTAGGTTIGTITVNVRAVMSAVVEAVGLTV